MVVTTHHLQGKHIFLLSSFNDCVYNKQHLNKVRSYRHIFQMYFSVCNFIQHKHQTSFLILPKITMYKWKYHFSEMKGDVGMSLHEKEGEQEDA